MYCTRAYGVGANTELVAKVMNMTSVRTYGNMSTDHEHLHVQVS